MIKTIFVAAFLIAIGYSIFALWQRQPKNLQLEENSSTPSASTKPQDSKSPLELTPQDKTVLNSSAVEIKGKTNPNVKILVYTNSNQYVATTDTNGNFSQKTNLGNGLNLVKVVPLDQNLQPTNGESLTLYSTKGDVGNKVIAGSVKSIFDNAITTTTQNGETIVKVAQNTSFDIPKDDRGLEATKEVDNIRIGDYLIATGDATSTTDQTSTTAKKLQILRQNKPQITEQVAIGTIGANPKQNIFPLKNKADGKLVELKLGKNTEVSQNGTDAKATDITKDKMAIVFYFKQDPDNIADLVYLLP